MRVINPPGGKCSINLFGDVCTEVQQPPSNTVNQCQTERTRSHVFTSDEEMDKSLEDANKKLEDESESPINSPKKSMPNKESIFPSSNSNWCPERISQKRQHPLSIRNKQSNIF